MNFFVFVGHDHRDFHIGKVNVNDDDDDDPTSLSTIMTNAYDERRNNLVIT